VERSKSTWESFNGSTKQIKILQRNSIIDRDKPSNLMVYSIFLNNFKEAQQKLTNKFCKYYVFHFPYVLSHLKYEDQQCWKIKKSHSLSQYN
jgi:hypothetical protein